MKRIWTVAATLVLGCAAWAEGGPVEFKNVAADAIWLAHVDFDAARASPVLQKLGAEVAKTWPQAPERIGQAGKRLGLAKFADLHDVTLYGATLQPHTGVMILHANWNKQVLGEKAKKAANHKTTKYGKHQICTWTERKGPGRPREVAGVLYKPDVLILGSSVSLVKSAIDVLDGKGANLTAKNAPLAAKADEGAIFLARAVGLNQGDAVKQCPFLRLVEQIDYAEGQRGGQWFGNLTVTTKSKTVADDLKKIADGFGALASLKLHDQADLAAMLHRHPGQHERQGGQTDLPRTGRQTLGPNPHRLEARLRARQDPPAPGRA